jgi:hypothetical protein
MRTPEVERTPETGTPDKPAKKSGRSVFGPAGADRPDVLTDAETVVLPAQTSPVSVSNIALAATAGEVAAAKPALANGGAGAAAVPADTGAVADTDTGIPVQLPVAETIAVPAPRSADRAYQQEEPYTPSRRRTLVSRGVLLAILCMQAVLSLRLHNTAFEDEALYLYSGHMELEHILHGTALQGDYASYFSGSPVLYPVAAAVLDEVGGLTAARALSLAEMLSITALLYSLTRRLFNERVGLCAALLFAVTESAIFLGNFATYDATCLFLLASAAWIMVRTASSRWPLFLLAAPVAALAVAVKYAGALFVPTIAILPVLCAWPPRGRRVLLYPLVFGACVGGLLFEALRLGGHAYLIALESTTTNRAQGTTPMGTLLRESVEWGGLLFALALIGTVAYVLRTRTEPDEQIAPAGGRLRRAALGIVLTGTALLAPAYQVHLHTDVSLLKHIGFGLFFAAPMAGLGLARLMGDHFRRPQLGIGIWSLALVLGMAQSSHLYQVWPSSGPFVHAFSAYLRPNARYLVEVPEVPIYYLTGNPDAQPFQFTSTFYISYTTRQGQTLTGTAGFTAAVKAGYFRVIAYDGDVTQATDAALAKALAASPEYYLAKRVDLHDTFGPVDYDIWVRGRAPRHAVTQPHVNLGHFFRP